MPDRALSRAAGSRVFAAIAWAFIVAPLAAQTPESVVDWIRASAIELDTVEPGGEFDDLMPLKEMIGGARIVGLGDATHGTHEAFRLKHRLFEFLVEEMGFTVFALEAGMPECMAINDYVQGGEGDPAAALNGQGFWTWDTEEVLALIEWMCDYNADPAHEAKLQFYGCDMQSGASALYHAMRFLRPAFPEQVAAIEQRIPLLTSGGYQSSFGMLSEGQRANMEGAIDELIKLFDDNKEALADRSSAREWGLMRRNAVVARQFAEMVRTQYESATGTGAGETQRLASSIGNAASDLYQYLDTTDFAFADQVQPFLANLIGQDGESIINRYRDELTDRERGEWFGIAQSIVGRLERLSAVFIARSNQHAYTEATRHAADIVAFLDVCEEIQQLPERPPNVRDRCMAENVAWLLEREGPDAKIAVWTHNEHVQHNPAPPGAGSMGNELRRAFGDEYLAIGFSFNRGEFQAMYQPADGKWDGKPALRPHRVGNAKHDSFDLACAETGLPRFVLDVRQAPRPGEGGNGAARGEVAGWFARPHPLRMIGEVFGPHLEQSSYTPVIIADHFDLMIFTYETTAARPNPLTRQLYGIPD